MTFRYRALDVNSDMTFGQSQANMLVDSPAAIGQAVMTRLSLWQGEWFLDLLEGTPWNQQILGTSMPNARDAAIRARILDTPFVTGIVDYASSVDSRALSVSCKINTAFGATTVILPFAFPALGPFQIGTSPIGGGSGV